MHKLYFIRHGQSTDNAAAVFSGPDTQLTAKGRADAQTAGKNAKDKGLHFDAIISSPYPRAIQTAQLLAAEIGFPEDRIETSSLLVERNFGQIVGKPSTPYLGGRRNYQELDMVDGAETVEALQERATAALKMIQSRPEDTILIVSHNAFGRALRRVINKVPYTDEYRDPAPHDSIPNTTIVELI